jgi:hypothetical protein
LRAWVRQMEIIDSIAFVTSMKGHGATGSVGLPAPGGPGWVGLRCDRPGQGRWE